MSAYENVNLFLIGYIRIYLRALKLCKSHAGSLKSFKSLRILKSEIFPETNRFFDFTITSYNHVIKLMACDEPQHVNLVAWDEFIKSI